MKICYIAGAGEFTPRDLQPKDGDFVIAADGGLRALEKMNIKPDLLIGDLDSLGDHPLPGGVPLEKHPVEKDDTDTGIALAQGYAMGYRAFVLCGCAGGRIDHLLANFQSMARYSKMGASVRLIAPEYDAYALTNSSMTLPHRPEGTTVSIFCHGDKAEGVTLQGLYYPLEGYTLTSDHPLGVSNQHTSETAVVSVQSGTLLIVQYLSKEV
ncbi:MAG: thiamine diphosphokinase [Clostridia bacterium]|nr:thiamine diphosphokinase [Clostridia bacterium]